MALADYFHRGAVAAAQVLQGYDEDAIAERLDKVPAAVSISEATLDRQEGRNLLDLTVRLLARLYPRLTLAGPAAVGPWRELAIAINPALDLDNSDPAIAICIGDGARLAPVQIYVGSDAWDAHLSMSTEQAIGTTGNPFGAGVAACLGAANLFRRVFLSDSDADDSVIFSGLTLRPEATVNGPPTERLSLGDRNALVGAGAIGQAAQWALGRLTLDGELHAVDDEAIDLGNLQRYVLTVRTDVDRAKVDVVADLLAGDVLVRAHMRWQDFVAEVGHRWDRVLVAVDSAKARHAVQATLPRWIANAWTQPGDLGVSVHPWTSTGACLSCLYLPNGPLPDEDDLIADALGLSRDRDGLELRRLLSTGEPPSVGLLERVAAGLGVPLELCCHSHNVHCVTSTSRASAEASCCLSAAPAGPRSQFTYRWLTNPPSQASYSQASLRRTFPGSGRVQPGSCDWMFFAQSASGPHNLRRRTLAACAFARTSPTNGLGATNMSSRGMTSGRTVPTPAVRPTPPLYRPGCTRQRSVPNYRPYAITKEAAMMERHRLPAGSARTERGRSWESSHRTRRSSPPLAHQRVLR